jgi:hypothetical protein
MTCYGKDLPFYIFSPLQQFYENVTNLDGAMAKVVSRWLCFLPRLVGEGCVVESGTVLFSQNSSFSCQCHSTSDPCSCFIYVTRHSLIFAVDSVITCNFLVLFMYCWYSLAVPQCRQQDFGLMWASGFSYSANEMWIEISVRFVQLQKREEELIFYWNKEKLFQISDDEKKFSK